MMPTNPDDDAMGYALVDETLRVPIVNIEATAGGIIVEYLMTAADYGANMGAAVAWLTPEGRSVSPLGRLPVTVLLGESIYVRQAIWLHVGAADHPWQTDPKTRPGTRPGPDITNPPTTEGNDRHE